MVWVGSAVGWLLAQWLGRVIYGPDYSLARHAFLAIATTALLVPIVMPATRYLDRRPVGELGLARLGVGWRQCAIGVAGYVVPAALALTAFVVVGWIELSGTASEQEIAALGSGLVVLVLLYEALPEELLFRGYIQSNLLGWLSAGRAVTAQAVLFTLWGIAVGAARSPGRVTLFLVVGAVLGQMRVESGSLWAAVGFHLAFQVPQQLLSPLHQQVLADEQALVELVALGLVPVLGGALALERLARRGAFRIV